MWRKIIILVSILIIFTSCKTLFKPRKAVEKPKEPIHIMFAFVDHWESTYDETRSVEKANLWYKDFNTIAQKHRDADGVMPQHSWFVSDLYDPPLRIIAKCVYENLGEIEIHIHHGTANDTEKDNTEEMTKLLDKYLGRLKEYGACHTLEKNPQTMFGFIHGNWSLDNSLISGNIRKYCGVNREIDLLLSKGCYGDFTFPCNMPMTPSWNSKIMVSKDCPQQKSYDIQENLRELKVGSPRPSKDEMLILLGPGGSSPSAGSTHYNPDISIMKRWVDENIHVEGRDNWIFIKVYIHSVQASDSKDGVSRIYGDIADKFYTEIEKEYNDGVNYKLHYVTSREMFNIIMAAVDGKTGNPGDYRDYVIKKPVNRYFYSDGYYNLISYDEEKQSAEIFYRVAKAPLTIWSKLFTPDCVVMERISSNPQYQKSDAIISSNEKIPFILTDNTPSAYYLIMKKPKKKSFFNFWSK